MSEGGEARPPGADRWVEALTWYDTLRKAGKKDLTSALAREWLHWSADAENRRIFDNVSRLLGHRSLYRARSLPSGEELDADRYDLSVPIAEWRKAHAADVARKEWVSGRNWRLCLSGGFAAAIAVLVMFWPARFWSARKSRRHRC